MENANDEIKDHILWPVNFKSFLELALKKITHGCSPFFFNKIDFNTMENRELFLWKILNLKIKDEIPQKVIK